MGENFVKKLSLKRFYHFLPQNKLAMTIILNAFSYMLGLTHKLDASFTRMFYQVISHLDLKAEGCDITMKHRAQRTASVE